MKVWVFGFGPDKKKTQKACIERAEAMGCKSLVLETVGKTHIDEVKDGTYHILTFYHPEYSIQVFDEDKFKTVSLVLGSRPVNPEKGEVAIYCSDESIVSIGFSAELYFPNLSNKKLHKLKVKL